MNFINSNITEADKELFFGPLLENETFTVIEDHWKMAHVIHKAGLFPSVSQARKNGWNKELQHPGERNKKFNCFFEKNSSRFHRQILWYRGSEDSRRSKTRYRQGQLRA